MRPRRPGWPAALAIAAALAGCSNPPPPPPPLPGPPPKPIPIDGTYNGIMTLIRGSAVSCGNQNPITLQVVNLSFHYVLSQPQIVWQPTRKFDVAIKADGSFSTEAGSAYMRGWVRSGHMQGEIAGDACGFTFEADSTGTF